MNILYKPLSSASRGFSLLEILIVIAIIGILANIAIPNYLLSTKQAEAARMLNNAIIVYEASIMYHNLHKEWPRDSWWGVIPRGLEDFLPDHFTFRYPDIRVLFSFDNYTRFPQWARRYGVMVCISINSSDKTLIKFIHGLSDGKLKLLRGFFGWSRVVYIIQPAPNGHQKKPKPHQKKPKPKPHQK